MAVGERYNSALRVEQHWFVDPLLATTVVQPALGVAAHKEMMILVEMAGRVFVAEIGVILVLVAMADWNALVVVGRTPTLHLVNIPGEIELQEQAAAAVVANIVVL